LQHPAGVQHYHERRNGMLEFLDSSKLSPWLAWGCISPLRVAHELLELISKGTNQEGADKLLYELYWREFFKHTSLGLGQDLFSLSGRRTRAPDITASQELFERWKLGNTGQRFNDANMRELLFTGWMSNRGRQNVASYWSKTLQGDWRWGSRWFSERLIDYDPESNWGNWQYVAGVGYDPRDRVFNLDRQAEMYDPTGAYQRRWLEEEADSHLKLGDQS
jgi:deoxyribodipyrimidine photo-lyase